MAAGNLIMGADSYYTKQGSGRPCAHILSELAQSYFTRTQLAA